MRYALVIALCGCIGGDPSWEKITKGDQSHIVVQKKMVAARPVLPNVTWLLDRPRDDVRTAIIDLIERKHSEFRFGVAFTGSTCGSNVVFPPGTEPGVLMRSLESPPTDRIANWAASLAVMPVNDVRREDFVVFVTSSAGDECGGDAVGAVTALRSHEVRTIVVNLGLGSATLEAMVAAGGFQQGYAAPDAAAFQAFLDEIFTPLPTQSLCKYTLSVVPSSPDRVVVLVADVHVSSPEDYEITDDTLLFKGPVCERIQSGTVDYPVPVEIRIDTRP